MGSTLNLHILLKTPNCLWKHNFIQPCGSLLPIIKFNKPGCYREAYIRQEGQFYLSVKKQLDVICFQTIISSERKSGNKKVTIHSFWSKAILSSKVGLKILAHKSFN